MCGNVKLLYTIQEFMSGPSMEFFGDPLDHNKGTDGLGNVETIANYLQSQHDEKQESDAEDDLEEDEMTANEFGLSPQNTVVNGRTERKDWSLPPHGLFCPRPDIYRRRLPEIPGQFSVKIETVDEVRKNTLGNFLLELKY